MFEEYKYRIELHAHTSPASGCSEIPPEQLVNTYREKGCDAVCITNHFTSSIHVEGRSCEEALDFYWGDFERAKAEGDRIGIKVIFGMELRFIENNNDYLIYGVDREEAGKIYPMVKGTMAEFRADYVNDRAVFIQAHPFRNGMTQVDPALLDGIESFNMHANHNSRVAYGARYANQIRQSRPDFISTIGSDYHHPGMDNLGITLAKTLPNDSFELAALLRSQDYIFDICGCRVLPY